MNEEAHSRSGASPVSTVTHFNIVALETFFTPLPALTLPSGYTFDLTEYVRTKVDEIPSRIQDADVLITTTIALAAGVLSPEVSPRLKLILLLASGTDSVDLKACAARGIPVLNSPNCNASAVAEHAVALYFTCRRLIVPTMRNLLDGEWPRRGTLMKTAYVAEQPPRSCREETVAIVGYGGVGHLVAEMLGGLGMKILIAGRKGAAMAAEGRTPFEDALRAATVIVLCCPRTPETLKLLSVPEFAMMREDVVLINVARGGIVDETELLTALKNGQVAGAAVDVFAQEPASPETSPLLGIDSQGLNLVVTPHTAWIGRDTTANYQRLLQENINGFVLSQVEAGKLSSSQAS